MAVLVWLINVCWLAGWWGCCWWAMLVGILLGVVLVGLDVGGVVAGGWLRIAQWMRASLWSSC